MDSSILILLLVVLALIAVWKFLFRKETVFEYERALLFKNGKLVKVLEPGGHWIRPTSTKLVKIDVRQRFLHVVGQELMSLDNVGLKISLVAQYGIVDVEAAVLKTEAFQTALYTVLQLAAREVIGADKIDDVLEKRSTIGPRVLAIVAAQAREIGLDVTSVNVRDIMFSGELKRVFAQVVKARKEGEAALEKARGETAALRNLANAAKLVESNPALMQVRLLQSVGDSTGNTLVLGVPSGYTPIPAKGKSGAQPPAQVDED